MAAVIGHEDEGRARGEMRAAVDFQAMRGGEVAAGEPAPGEAGGGADEADFAAEALHARAGLQAEIVRGLVAPGFAHGFDLAAA